MWPAQELVRVIDSEHPRDWATRWAEAGGEFSGGRMIALKNDPIWEKISRFGTPYPPFDFNSGMDVADVDRDEAVALGLIDRDEQVEPQIEDFNARLEASLPDADPATMEGLRDIFGDQVAESREGKVTWQGSRIRKLYEQALGNPEVKWTIDLGEAQPAAVDQARAAGVDLAGARLKLDADHIRHADQRHGAGETRADQRPLTALDFELVPHVWRQPDSVAPGTQPGDLVFTRKLDDTLVFATWKRAPNGSVRLHSLVAKKEGGRP
jgi:hypothetical protein